jgi:RNA polymerase sigma factor (sigma-70 family)
MVAPTTRTEAEQTFLAHLALIERIIAAVARRHALVGDDADDFASWTRTRLIENDYAILQKFESRSSMATYLTVVIANLFRDYRVQQWGRWRPSVAARRLGDTAVRLEMLLHRDGHSLAQACELLRSAGLTELGDRELADLAARLPARVRTVEVVVPTPPCAEAEQRADSELWRGEDEEEWQGTSGALQRALAALPAEDQVILRLRYWDGFSVADIARTLRLEQKPLYRRLDRDLLRLKELLEADGVDAPAVSSFFSSEFA